jgi:hypothetical protein
MQNSTLRGMGVMVLAVTTLVAAQSFKVYPGAKKLVSPETKESKEASASLPAGTEINSYLTDDSFEKVVAFYKGLGKESSLPFMKKGEKLPNGQEIKRTWFIFDGAEDISTSTNWAMVQRPYIGSVEMKGTTPQYHDIRDVTAITVEKVTTK